MKISIITVTFNNGAVLKDCIKSVISQEYDNTEHIIIDGASTDNTKDILMLSKILNDFNQVSFSIFVGKKAVYNNIRDRPE